MIVQFGIIEASARQKGGWQECMAFLHRSPMLHSPFLAIFSSVTTLGARELRFACPLAGSFSFSEFDASATQGCASARKHPRLGEDFVGGKLTSNLFPPVYIRVPQGNANEWFTALSDISLNMRNVPEMSEEEVLNQPILYPGIVMAEVAEPSPSDAVLPSFAAAAVGGVASDGSYTRGREGDRGEIGAEEGGGRGAHSRVVEGGPESSTPEEGVDVQLEVFPNPAVSFHYVPDMNGGGYFGGKRGTETQAGSKSGEYRDRRVPASAHAYMVGEDRDDVMMNGSGSGGGERGRENRRAGLNDSVQQAHLPHLRTQQSQQQRQRIRISGSTTDKEGSAPPLDTIPLGAPVSDIAQSGGVEGSGFFCYVRSSSAADFRKGWYRRWCIYEDGFVFLFRERFDHPTAIQDAHEPTGGLPVYGASIEKLDECGCYRWDYPRHKSIYIYPGEDAESLFSIIAEKASYHAPLWLQSFSKVNSGVGTMLTLGWVAYKRALAGRAEAAINAWLKRGWEEATDVEHEFFDKIVEVLDDTYMYFFSDFRPGDILFYHTKDGKGPPLVHRMRIEERGEKAVRAGATPKRALLCYPSGVEMELFTVWKRLRTTGFSGPMFRCDVGGRFERIHAQYKERFDPKYRRQHVRLAIAPAFEKSPHTRVIQGYEDGVYRRASRRISPISSEYADASIAAREGLQRPQGTGVIYPENEAEGVVVEEIPESTQNDGYLHRKESEIGGEKGGEKTREKEERVEEKRGNKEGEVVNVRRGRGEEKEESFERGVNMYADAERSTADLLAQRDTHKKSKVEKPSWQVTAAFTSVEPDSERRGGEVNGEVVGWSAEVEDATKEKEGRTGGVGEEVERRVESEESGGWSETRVQTAGGTTAGVSADYASSSLYPTVVSNMELGMGVGAGLGVGREGRSLTSRGNDILGRASKLPTLSERESQNEKKGGREESDKEKIQTEIPRGEEEEREEVGTSEDIEFPAVPTFDLQAERRQSAAHLNMEEEREEEEGWEEVDEEDERNRESGSTSIMQPILA
mmetsp:Transcript_34375/g.88915  ORF Transcript_34375/g.88915 Transcript_34375/m.88915 type:complete len:1029 (-) Transcript_34375:384-3470(-)